MLEKMKQCEKCIFYNAEYDKLLQSGCRTGRQRKTLLPIVRLFDGAVDDDIITDKVKCEWRIQ